MLETQNPPSQRDRQAHKGVLALDDVVVISSRQRLKSQLSARLGLPASLGNVGRGTLAEVLAASTGLRVVIVDVTALFESQPAPPPPLPPRPPIVMVVGYRQDADYVIAAANEGIAVQVLEHLRPEALLDMVICTPEVAYLQRGVGDVTAHLVHQLLERRWQRRRLTKTEARVYELMLRGASNQEIACSLGTQLKTVKNHLTSAYRKMAVRGRHEALARAAST